LQLVENPEGVRVTRASETASFMDNIDMEYEKNSGAFSSSVRPLNLTVSTSNQRENAQREIVIQRDNGFDSQLENLDITGHTK